MMYLHLLDLVLICFPVYFMLIGFPCFGICWHLQEKEGLITELRKELRVSDDEHRELLTKVNADDIIRRIRFGCFMNYSDFRFQ